jgi:hypothetical protein
MAFSNCTDAFLFPGKSPPTADGPARCTQAARTAGARGDKLQGAFACRDVRA